MLTLVLALHNHQPVGNFDDVYRQAVDTCYRPLLDELARFPRLKFALHHSGSLLDWLDEHEPGYVADVAALARSAQVELLGGGYYEPILAAIPPDDARGQLLRMQDYWVQRAAIRPRGAWLAERVWEPSLVPLLADSGIGFTFIDDTLFHQAGIPLGPVSGRFRTERAGRQLDLFPIDRELRYRIPFQPVAELAQYLRGGAERDLTLTYADDGEKLGLWPGTHEWVFERGWLRDFCAMLDEHRELVATAHPSAIERAAGAQDRIYPPGGSYDEMQTWALPTEARRAFAKATEAARERAPEALRFLRGSVWEGFLAKYPEARRMHERMLGVSRRLGAARVQGLRGAQLAAVEREVYRAQCNCAYWHGLFGGLYLGHLRHAVFVHLLRADALLDAAQATPGAALEGGLADVARLSSATLEAFVEPRAGGALVELDVKSRAFNLLNTLARWEEAYHSAAEAPATSGDAAAPLVFDRRRRAAFVDHVWQSDASFAELLHGQPRALANPGDAAYRVVSAGRERIDLEWSGEIAARPLRLRKSYALADGGAAIAVRLAYQLLGGAPIRVRLVSEINLTVLAGSAPDRYARIDGVREATMTAAASDGVRAATAVDEAFGFEMQVECASPRVASLWRFPVETWTRSEQAIVRAYQGSAWYWVFEAELDAAAEPVALELRLGVKLLDSTLGRD